MTLFLSLLPIYIFGNLHCAGMCGPLVMLLAQHPHKWWYFLGRLVAFTVVGGCSAEIGMTLFAWLAQYHVSALFSLLFGSWIVLLGSCLLMKRSLPGSTWLAKKTGKASHLVARLALHPAQWAIFLFGTTTVLLPCGQTLIVFSVIALNASPLEGLFNGCVFALLTSPALIAAMRASHIFQKARHSYPLWMGSATLLIGVFSLLRGCADLEWIQHWVLNPSAASKYHIVLF